MQPIYYGEEVPYKFSRSIFLAGPSLRTGQEGTSWRKDALDILKDIGFDDGVVFIPENRNGRLDENHHYEETVGWEQKHLDIADCILFWVPRKMDTLPGLTTNIEYGKYYATGKCVLGFPEDAEKVHYLDFCAEKNDIPVSNSLAATIHSAIELIGKPAERVNGERYIPLFIWHTPMFQSWYGSICDAGNRLESAQVLSTVRPLNRKNPHFIASIRPNIYIAKEDRFKPNEIVILRPDIASVCLWKEIDDGEDMVIALIKEFRTPARNDSGFVHELPGGSIDPGEDAKTAAIREVLEEAGLDMDEDRLYYVGARQLCSTLLSHQSHLFSYALNDEELELLKSKKGISMGEKKEGEKTFVEIVKLSELEKGNGVDYSMIGMIRSAAGKV